VVASRGGDDRFAVRLKHHVRYSRIRKPQIRRELRVTDNSDTKWWNRDISFGSGSQRADPQPAVCHRGDVAKPFAGRAGFFRLS
jgi:hypothetical protein